MSATNEKNRGEMAPVPNIVHNEQHQQRAEDTHELVLFGAYFDVLTQLELDFLVHHYNNALPMGRSISILDIKHFPIAEITSFIKSITETTEIILQSLILPGCGACQGLYRG